jgi:hypothetical protein
MSVLNTRRRDHPVGLRRDATRDATQSGWGGAGPAGSSTLPAPRARGTRAGDRPSLGLLDRYRPHHRPDRPAGSESASRQRERKDALFEVP